jgi:hypothetical protein
MHPEDDHRGTSLGLIGAPLRIQLALDGSPPLPIVVPGLPARFRD